MDPVRQAIVGHLLATPAVTSLLGAPSNVFHRVAPRNATPPFVVLHRQAETDVWTFNGPPLEDELWTVKGICRGTSSAQADDIAQALTAALNDAAISIDGYVLLQLRRESKVDYGERDGDDQWHHVGGIFRVDVDPVP
jgi:hypothetical protein